MPADKKTDTVSILLKRDHWIGEERHKAGEKLDVSLDDALRLIERGVAGRTDPLKAE